MHISLSLYISCLSLCLLNVVKYSYKEPQPHTKGSVCSATTLKHSSQGTAKQTRDIVWPFVSITDWRMDISDTFSRNSFILFQLSIICGICTTWASGSKCAATQSQIYKVWCRWGSFPTPQLWPLPLLVKVIDYKEVELFHHDTVMISKSQFWPYLQAWKPEVFGWGGSG